MRKARRVDDPGAGDLLAGATQTAVARISDQELAHESFLETLTPTAIVTDTLRDSPEDLSFHFAITKTIESRTCLTVRD